MRRRSPAYVLVFGLFATLFAGRQSRHLESHAHLAPPSGAVLHGSRDRARFVVQFEHRDFTLDAFRRAILARRPAAEIDAIVEDLDRRAAAAQAPFRAAVEQLGGQVLEHLWLIDACTVDAPSDAADALRELPNVAEVLRDRAARPGEPGWTAPFADRGAPHDDGAEPTAARRYDGAGIALAILDTGQDEDCGGSGRPHPLYFGAGDGPGIGGSRLLQNLQFGAFPKDDVIGHGTAVAAVAAGARWNAPGAAAGHAPAAAIAGYAIADRADGAASDCAILSAWQQVARDRARLSLVGANLSYSGSPDPTDPVQQALDSAAHNADLLITVCAFNTGALGAAHSQSACNGLAVGAVTADLDVADYSARGPLVPDTRRTYPDLCAIADTISPNPDCERGAGARSGTSFAAPQVLGAGALVRQAAPGRTALETKAVLLAATTALDARGAGDDRNATGVGLLQETCAVATALDPRRCGTVRVDLDRVVRVPVPVLASQPTAVAITWHRTVLRSTDWTDVDLRVVDQDGAVLAEGAAERNLYEQVRFVPRTTGEVTLELRAVRLPHGGADVAFAVAELPSPPLRASYASVGAPCAADAAPAAALQACNGDATEDDLARDRLQLSATEWLFAFTAEQDLAIGGFEALLGLHAGAAELPTALYLGTDAGTPQPTAAARGSMFVGRQPGWNRTRFDRPVQVTRGQRYFVAFHPPAGGCAFALRRGAAIEAQYRWPCSDAFVPGGNAPAALRVLGADHGRALEPQLGNRGLPVLGGGFAAELHQLAPRAPVLLATAVAAMTPRALDPFLQLGCRAQVALDRLDATVGDDEGRCRVPFTIPDLGVLRGLEFAQQGFALDSDGDQGRPGVRATHATAGRIGGPR
ncbi:MAG: S8 family serine peptidase [Planctomycetota bacterium]